MFLITFKKKSKKRGRQEQVTGDDQDVEVRLSSSKYEGSCPELSHLYHDSGNNKEATSTQIWSKLLSYNKGSSKIVASEKHDPESNLTEENKKLYFQAYKRLADIFFELRRLKTLLLTPL